MSPIISANRENKYLKRLIIHTDEIRKYFGSSERVPTMMLKAYSVISRYQVEMNLNCYTK